MVGWLLYRINKCCFCRLSRDGQHFGLTISLLKHIGILKFCAHSVMPHISIIAQTSHAWANYTSLSDTYILSHHNDLSTWDERKRYIDISHLWYTFNVVSSKRGGHFKSRHGFVGCFPSHLFFIHHSVTFFYTFTWICKTILHGCVGYVTSVFMHIHPREVLDSIACHGQITSSDWAEGIQWVWHGFGSGHDILHYLQGYIVCY